MGVKYKEEHLSCGYYQKGPKVAIIDVLHFEKGEEIRREISECVIVFVKKGSGRVSYHKVLDREVEPNRFLLLPPSINLYAKAEEDTSVLTFRMESTMKLCNTYSLEKLYKESNVPFEDFYLLGVENDRLSRYLDLLMDCLSDGIRCSNFLNNKLTELMYYLRIYYTKEELSKFLSPILSGDFSFADFVFQNYKKAKNVQQLSGLYGYSQSSFEKQFKKVFGVSAYQWMIDKKAKQIYHKLACSDKSFSEIAFEYDFLSSSQFCDFCKNFLGASPKEIRHRKICKI